MKDSRILVTGGTGSFGKAFTQRILRENPKRLVIYSRGEHAQETMAREFEHPSLRFFIGDVRDEKRLAMALRDIDIVVHASALKIVPTCEYNPQEAVQTNVMGAQNVISAAIANGVKKVVALSTDKACNPTNLYGATKLCAERLFLSAHALGGDGGPLFSVVRYGNVLGSRGSVVPYFSMLAATGKCLPITDENMTRFIITLPEAVEFVMGCLEEMRGREIFVPRIPSIKILDLAKAVWSKENNGDIRWKTVGIRPGEKLHEVLVSADEAPNTIVEDARIIIQAYGGDLLSRYKYLGGDRQYGVLRQPYTSDTNTEWLSVEQFRGMI